MAAAAPEIERMGDAASADEGFQGVEIFARRVHRALHIGGRS
jgi:hypothetical protein